MRVAIVGSRSITDQGCVIDAISKIAGDLPPSEITIVSGGARGVDSVARKVAETMNMDFILFKPYHLVDNSVEYSPKFFFVRNKQIADNSDHVAIIWDGVSKGSEHMIKYCKKKGKAYTIFQYEESEVV